MFRQFRTNWKFISNYNVQSNDIYATITFQPRKTNAPKGLIWYKIPQIASIQSITAELKFYHLKLHTSLGLLHNHLMDRNVKFDQKDWEGDYAFAVEGDRNIKLHTEM